MPKPYTFPTLYDDLKIVSISLLAKNGYLKANQWQRGTITWSRDGKETGSISIFVDTCTANPYLELDYKCNEAPIKYKVHLVSVPSNLGKGFIWYFICPHTRKLCRKLYLAANYFYHRAAFNGCMYETQTRSKKSRYLDKTLGAYFKSDQIYKQLYTKHFKKQYAGNPTKKYLKLAAQIRQIERIPYEVIERAMIS